MSWAVDNQGRLTPQGVCALKHSFQSLPSQGEYSVGTRSGREVWDYKNMDKNAVSKALGMNSGDLPFFSELASQTFWDYLPDESQRTTVTEDELDLYARKHYGKNASELCKQGQV